MEEKKILVQAQKPHLKLRNNSTSKFTIKLIGDANDLSEIVSDINSEYRLNSQFNDQVSVKSESGVNIEPPKKKLKMKEEILPQRVILVVPKNSPSHYPLSPKNDNKLIAVENQKRNLQLENSEIKNNQQNNKSFTQNIIEDKNEKNLSMNNDNDMDLKHTELPNLNETYKEDIQNCKKEYKRFSNNHEAEILNSKQVTNPQLSFKQLHERKSKSLGSVIDRHKVRIIKRPLHLENFLTKPIKRKLNVAENISHSKTLSQNCINNLQPVPDKNPTQESIVLNRLIPMKILHSPIVLRKSHPTNYFKQNKLPNGEQKMTSNTDFVNEKIIEDDPSPVLSLDDLTVITNCLTDNQLVNTATINRLSKDVKTYRSLVRKKNIDVSPSLLKTNQTITESSLSENKHITTKNQEQLLGNTKIDTSLHNYSLNSIISESTTESKPNIRQNAIPSKIMNSETTRPVLDDQEKNVSQESNNHEGTNGLEIPEKKKHSVQSSLDKIIHEACNKKQSIKSPQIRVNGLMIRAPDPNLLNNLALKEKIQEFRLSNKPFEKVTPPSHNNIQHECTEKRNHSVILPEVSESLVSTTTVESGQLDRKIKDCQCDQLRQEVNHQWKIMTNLRSRINSSLKDINHKCDSLAEENSQLIEDKHIYSVMLKEIEETNRKITENLRKEQIRNNTLKITLKHKNIRIKQLENELKTVSKIFEETEQNAIYLRNLLKKRSRNNMPYMI